MKKDAKQTALTILNIIKTENIVSYTNCLTRLKISLKQDVNYNIEQLKQVKTVIELLVVSNSGEIQIVFASDFVVEVKTAFDQLIKDQR